ncbi:hypothetical protein G6F47_001796 [Rhizopus delemar]|nr:hypothetical protein G6F54_001014 [Rhizopus delemar]KAG1518932.1 hypothetical protein G6F53_000175 [Rhizopus delemar]KAG1603493.1 hypothetical protein G6F47_001796 [Rhizopus delemar]
MFPHRPLSVDIGLLSLEADESEMVVCYTTSTTTNEETAEGNIDGTEENDKPEQDEQCVDIVDLCKNGIVDMTMSSDRNQMDVIGGKHVKSIMTKYLDAFGDENNSDNSIGEVTKPLLKLKNKRKMEEYYYKHLVRYKPKNDIERNVLNIYKYVVEQHVFRSFMFRQSYINSCSEQSLNIKYRSYLFASFFGRNKDVFLQWGETKAVDCTRAALDFKLDLRIIVNIEQEKHEVATAELAKPRSTIESKLFNDKLKLVLVTKCHLNSVLKTMPYIPKSKVKDVKVPIVQIIGLTCHVQALSLTDKGVYLLQDVYSVDYPQTHAQVEAKGLQKVIESFSIIDDLIIDITEYHRDYNVDQSSKMDSLIKGKKKNNVNIEDWVSEVVCDDDMAHDN